MRAKILKPLTTALLLAMLAEPALSQTVICLQPFCRRGHGPSRSTHAILGSELVGIGKHASNMTPAQLLARKAFLQKLEQTDPKDLGKLEKEVDSIKGLTDKEKAELKKEVQTVKTDYAAQQTFSKKLDNIDPKNIPNLIKELSGLKGVSDTQKASLTKQLQTMKGNYDQTQSFMNKIDHLTAKDIPALAKELPSIKGLSTEQKAQIKQQLDFEQLDDSAKTASEKITHLEATKTELQALMKEKTLHDVSTEHKADVADIEDGKAHGGWLRDGDQLNKDKKEKGSIADTFTASLSSKTSAQDKVKAIAQKSADQNTQLDAQRNADKIALLKGQKPVSGSTVDAIEAHYARLKVANTNKASSQMLNLLAHGDPAAIQDATTKFAKDSQENAQKIATDEKKMAADKVAMKSDQSKGIQDKAAKAKALQDENSRYVSATQKAIGETNTAHVLEKQTHTEAKTEKHSDGKKVYSLAQKQEVDNPVYLATQRKETTIQAQAIKGSLKLVTEEATAQADVKKLEAAHASPAKIQAAKNRAQIAGLQAETIQEGAQNKIVGHLAFDFKNTNIKNWNAEQNLVLQVQQHYGFDDRSASQKANDWFKKNWGWFVTAITAGAATPLVGVSAAVSSALPIIGTSGAASTAAITTGLQYGSQQAVGAISSQIGSEQGQLAFEGIFGTLSGMAIAPAVPTAGAATKMGYDVGTTIHTAQETGNWDQVKNMGITAGYGIVAGAVATGGVAGVGGAIEGAAAGAEAGGSGAAGSVINSTAEGAGVAAETAAESVSEGASSAAPKPSMLSRAGSAVKQVPGKAADFVKSIPKGFKDNADLAAHVGKQFGKGIQNLAEGTSYSTNPGSVAEGASAASTAASSAEGAAASAGKGVKFNETAGTRPVQVESTTEAEGPKILKKTNYDRASSVDETKLAEKPALIQEQLDSYGGMRNKIDEAIKTGGYTDAEGKEQALPKPLKYKASGGGGMVPESQQAQAFQEVAKTMLSPDEYVEYEKIQPQAEFEKHEAYTERLNDYIAKNKKDIPQDLLNQLEKNPGLDTKAYENVQKAYLEIAKQKLPSGELVLSEAERAEYASYDNAEASKAIKYGQRMKGKGDTPDAAHERKMIQLGQKTLTDENAYEIGGEQKVLYKEKGGKREYLDERETQKAEYIRGVQKTAELVEQPSLGERFAKPFKRLFSRGEPNVPSDSKVNFSENTPLVNEGRSAPLKTEREGTYSAKAYEARKELATQLTMEASSIQEESSALVPPAEKLMAEGVATWDQESFTLKPKEGGTLTEEQTTELNKINEAYKGIKERELALDAQVKPLVESGKLNYVEGKGFRVTSNMASEEGPVTSRMSLKEEVVSSRKGILKEPEKVSSKQGKLAQRFNENAANRTKQFEETYGAGRGADHEERLSVIKNANEKLKPSSLKNLKSRKSTISFSSDAELATSAEIKPLSQEDVQAFNDRHAALQERYQKLQIFDESLIKEDVATRSGGKLYPKDGATLKQRELIEGSNKQYKQLAEDQLAFESKANSMLRYNQMTFDEEAGQFKVAEAESLSGEKSLTTEEEEDKNPLTVPHIREPDVSVSTSSKGTFAKPPPGIPHPFIPPNAATPVMPAVPVEPVTPGVAPRTLLTTNEPVDKRANPNNLTTPITPPKDWVPQAMPKTNTATTTNAINTAASADAAAKRNQETPVSSNDSGVVAGAAIAGGIAAGSALSDVGSVAASGASDATSGMKSFFRSDDTQQSAPTSNSASNQPAQQTVQTVKQPVTRKMSQQLPQKVTPAATQASAQVKSAENINPGLAKEATKDVSAGNANAALTQVPAMQADGEQSLASQLNFNPQLLQQFNNPQTAAAELQKTENDTAIFSPGAKLDVDYMNQKRMTNYTSRGPSKAVVGLASVSALTRMGDWTSVYGSLTYSENANAVKSERVRPELDQLYLSLGNFHKTPWHVSFGQQYFPFGVYVPFSVTSNVNQSLEAVQGNGLLAGYQGQHVYGSGYVVSDSGKVNWQTHTLTPVLKNWGTELGLTFNNKSGFIGVNMNASYLNNFNQTGAMSSNLPIEIDRKGALATHIQFHFHQVGWVNDYTRVLSPYNKTAFAFDEKGAQPSAMTNQIYYHFYSFGKVSTIAANYQFSRQALGLAVPKWQGTAFYAIDVTKHLSLELQYSLWQDYGHSQTSAMLTQNSPNAMAGTGKHNSMVGFRLSFALGDENPDYPNV